VALAQAALTTTGSYQLMEVHCCHFAMLHRQAERIELDDAERRLARHFTQADNWRAALVAGNSVIILIEDDSQGHEASERWQQGIISRIDGESVTVVAPTDENKELLKCERHSRFMRYGHDASCDSRVDNRRLLIGLNPFRLLLVAAARWGRGR
jgi:hypothetical protein